MITIQAIIKDGGIERTAIPLKLLSGLAKGIKENGSEMIHLASGKSWEITGFIVTGEQTSKSVIILGKDDLKIDN